MTGKIFKQFFLIISLGIFSLASSLAQTPEERSSNPSSEASQPEPSKKSESSIKGINIQLLPAFYLNTWGVDLNFPVNKKIYVGLSYSSTFGNNTGDKQHFIIAQDYTKQGIRAQLSGMYFFGKKAPNGFYGQLNISYNTLIYYDGSTRPLSLFNHREAVSGLGNGTLVTSAKKVDLGIGLGYQIVIIPDHVIANILVGAQGNQSSTEESKLFMDIYIRPTIGLVF